MKMENKKDHCTLFPEYWAVWVRPFRWKIIYIGDCCKKHDEDCSTHAFAYCLWKRRAVGSYLIVLGGGIGCLVKYPRKIVKRIIGV